MQKKNLIYIIGGAAVVGYFIYMRSKKQTDQVEITTPDQQMAPAFVNEATENIKASAKRIVRQRKNVINRKNKNTPKTPGELISESRPQETGQNLMSETIIQNEDGGVTTVRELTPFTNQGPLTNKGKRVQARSVKKEIVASGGTRKQGRQAARSFKRSMGELPVFF